MDVDLKHASHSYLDDSEVKRLIALSQSGDGLARETLVSCNIRLVWSVVQRFLNRGYEAEDLFQIGCIGLLKSVDKFDLSVVDVARSQGEARRAAARDPGAIGRARRSQRRASALPWRHKRAQAPAAAGSSHEGWAADSSAHPIARPVPRF